MKLLNWFRTLPALTVFLTGFLLFAWSVLLLALFSVFSPWLITPLLILSGAFFGRGLFALWKERDFFRLILWGLSMLFAASITLTSEPTIFSGRDQGSIAEAAYRLATNHTLTFETPASRAFFEIYGPGTALNFPGFAYTESGKLVTQFPLAYTAWVGSFLSLFGLTGYGIANLVLLVFFPFLFFELLSLFVPRFLASGGTLLTALSFLPVWMAKYTLSENLAAVLFVGLAFSLIKFIQEKSSSWYFLTLAFALLFPFTRIEGFAFLILVFVLLLSRTDIRQWIFSSFWKRAFLPGSAFFLLFLRDFVVNLPFYKMIAKALIRHSQELSALGNLPESSGEIGLGGIFLSYGLFFVFLFGFLGILLALSKKERFPLLVLFLAAPTLIYLVAPSITPDHPWMLRRYFFSLYPTFVFFSVIGIWLLSRRTEGNIKKSWALSAFALLLFFQIGGFFGAWSTTENKGFQKEVSFFSGRFGERDLILIDRLVTSDPFALPTGPMNFLDQKQAVYFFNPNDLGRLDRSRFDKIYLVAPAESLSLYSGTLGEKLLPRETTTFTRSLSLPRENAFSLPAQVTVSTDNILFEVTP